MNAAVMADGHAEWRRRGAREALEAFWQQRFATAALFSPLQRGPLDVLLGRWTLDHSPAFVAMDLMARMFSPYDLNLGGPNPLQQILPTRIDFARLASAPIKLFVTATNVRTGSGRGVPQRARSRPTCCSPRPACRPCSRRSRSTAKPIGTAATPAIRR